MIEDGKTGFLDNKHLTLSEDDQNSTFRQPFLASKFWGSPSIHKSNIQFTHQLRLKQVLVRSKMEQLKVVGLDGPKFLGGGTAVDGNQKSGVH